MPEEVKQKLDAGQENKPWTIDVQRGLAWCIILLFTVITAAFAIRVAISAVVGDVIDLLKMALAVLFNIVMLILGFFFGASKTGQSMIASAFPPHTDPTSTVTTADNLTITTGEAATAAGDK